MGIKLFYNGKWFAFEAPKPQWWDKCNFDCRHFSKSSLEQFCGCYNSYHQAYAEAKANALEVGNVECMIEHTPLGGFEITFIDGIGCTSWPGSAVINDGKYILSI